MDKKINRILINNHNCDEYSVNDRGIDEIVHEYIAMFERDVLVVRYDDGSILYINPKDVYGVILK